MSHFHIYDSRLKNLSHSSPKFSCSHYQPTLSPIFFFFFTSSSSFLHLTSIPSPKLASFQLQLKLWGRIHELLLLFVLLWLSRAFILLIKLMIYCEYVSCYGWLNMKTFGLSWNSSEKLKGELKQNLLELKP